MGLACTKKCGLVKKECDILTRSMNFGNWLRLLVLSEYITEAEGNSLINDCLEIKRILISSLNTGIKATMQLPKTKTQKQSGRYGCRATAPKSSRTLSECA